MEKNDSGIYEININLPEGMYYYKLVINGVLWIEDLNAEKSLRKDDSMGFNNFNSGLFVKELGSDYANSGSDKINTGALVHNNSEKYYKILSPGKIKILLRTLEKNIDSARICFNDGKKESFEKLTVESSDNGFDFYSAEILLNSGESYFDYYFELRFGSSNINFPADKKYTGFTGVLSDIPEWAKKAVWYQIFPERFHNSDKTNDPKLRDLNEGDIEGWKISDWVSDWYSAEQWETEKYGSVFHSVFRRRYGGDLQGIIDKLDYLQELGINAIYLNPIFRSPSLHKYDGSSFHHIDENFGPDPEGDRKLIESANETDDPFTWVWTSADKLFLKLIKEVHRRKMKIIIDGVFNHSGRLFFGFQDIIKNKEKSRFVKWYSITKWDSNLDDGFEYISWFGHKSLPEFYRTEEGFYEGYENYVFNITKRWMAPEGNVSNGIDGWRLDVAYCVPHNFWKKWRRCVKSINSQSYITAEIIEPAPEFLRGDEFDGVMNYPFTTAVIQYFIDKSTKISAAEFDRKLRVLRELYPKEINYILQNLMSSHDTARLRSVIANPDLNYGDWGGYFNRSKLENNPDFRIDRGGEEECQTHKLIALFQMTYLGAPMIYYGDEVGMTGANDPDCRKPMLWKEFEYEDETVHPHKTKTKPKEKNVVDEDLFQFYKKIIRVRKDNIELQCGAYRTVVVDDEKGLFGFTRTYGNNAVFSAFNVSEKNAELVLDINEIFPDVKIKSGDLANDLMTGVSYKIENDKLKISISKRGAVLLKY